MLSLLAFTSLIVLTAAGEGDMLDFKQIDPQLAPYGYTSKSHMWQDHVVQVCWENPIDDDREFRLVAEEAIERSWERAVNIAFTGWSKCSPRIRGIRIYIIDDALAPRSLIGTRLDGIPRGMRLNFKFERWGNTACRDRKMDCIRVEAMHEFGHALGFIHESLRPDAPSDCKNSQVVQGDDSDPGDGEPRTPYDPESIMNYCTLIYGRQAELSRLDIEAAQIMYGAPITR